MRHAMFLYFSPAWRREEEGNRRRLRLLLEHLARLVPGHSRHPHIRDDDVGLDLRGALDQLRAIVDRDDLKSSELKRKGDQLPDVILR
jgi:hypothetical protein